MALINEPYPRMIFTLPDKDSMGPFGAQFWQLAQYSRWAFYFLLLSYRAGTKGCCLNEKNLFLPILF